MIRWFKNMFEPLPRSDHLRMPVDQREADRIFRVYDGQNGRYYITADVRFEDGTFVDNIVFHGDTRIAVTLESHTPIPDSLHSKTIAAVLVVRDRSGGSNERPDAGDLDRQRFRNASGG